MKCESEAVETSDGGQAKNYCDMETWIRLRQYSVVCGVVTYSNIPKMVLRVRNERKINMIFFQLFMIMHGFGIRLFELRVEMAQYICIWHMAGRYEINYCDYYFIAQNSRN